jgi:hypothetical protein
MNYNLYHVWHDTDAAARKALREMAAPVHSAGGALWLSLAHDHGESALVIALPEVATLDALEGNEPVATLTKGHFESIDPEFFPRYPDEETEDDEPQAGTR